MLIEELDTRANNSVNYREFLTLLNRSSADPQQDTTPWSEDDENAFQYLVSRLKRIYTVTGVDIKAAYEKFDQHNYGRVTKSQVFII